MSEWIWKPENIDTGRLSRALKEAPSRLIKDPPAARFIGSHGEYLCTLDQCNCPDFAIKGETMPCKHILRLALDLNIINKNGLTPDQQEKADIAVMRNELACAYGHYYLFGDSHLTDQEYDEMKERLIREGELTRKESAGSDSLYQEVMRHLKENALDYIDVTANGGSLYFYDQETAELFKKKGATVKYAESGTKKTGGKPAWYILFK